MTPEDLALVTELLGRPPRGECEIVVRGPAGEPVVIKNAAHLDDGTPMPTLYWLVGSWSSSGSWRKPTLAPSPTPTHATPRYGTEASSARNRTPTFLQAVSAVPDKE